LSSFSSGAVSTRSDKRRGESGSSIARCQQFLPINGPCNLRIVPKSIGFPPLPCSQLGADQLVRQRKAIACSSGKQRISPKPGTGASAPQMLARQK
jgi:hypothetical protein